MASSGFGRLGEDPSDRPNHWDLLIVAAYHRLLGSTQDEAGAAVGRASRTIRTWESDTATWQAACAEARRLWLGEVIALARRQLLKALDTADGDLALKILERMDPDFAPALQRHKVQHEVGDGISGLLAAFGETHVNHD